MNPVLLEVIFVCGKFAVCGLFELPKYMKVVPESKDRFRIAHTVHSWPQSNFHLFQALKEVLGGRGFTRDERLTSKRG
jgi:hypothetical protein